MGALFPHPKEGSGISPYIKLSELNMFEWTTANVSKYLESTRWCALEIVADLDKRVESEGWDRLVSSSDSLSNSIVSRRRIQHHVDHISSIELEYRDFLEEGFEGKLWFVSRSSFRSLFIPDSDELWRTVAAIDDLNLARDVLLEGTRKWGERFSKRDEDTFGSKRIRMVEARATGSPRSYSVKKRLQTLTLSPQTYISRLSSTPSLIPLSRLKRSTRWLTRFSRTILVAHGLPMSLM